MLELSRYVLFWGTKPMSATTALNLEQGLDPKNWADLRELGHRMIDDMFSYLENVGERPVWQPIPPQVKETFTELVPEEPQGASAAYDQFRRNILPYPTGNIHPRFWSWVSGTGSAGGMLAELLSGANAKVIEGALADEH